MGKWSKRISLVLVLILSIAIVKNLFTKSDTDHSNEIDYTRIYAQKTNPVSLEPKEDSYITKSPYDSAYDYTRLWKLKEIYEKYSKGCIENYLLFHPNIVVKRDNLFEYYGIKIGTSAWYDLVTAYEKQTIEICSSVSGKEIEDQYASIIRESFTKPELENLMDFYNSELGQKLVKVSLKINDTIQSEVSKSQFEAVQKETLLFNNETERLYLKYLEEDADWFERTWYKAFAK